MKLRMFFLCAFLCSCSVTQNSKVQAEIIEDDIKLVVEQCGEKQCLAMYYKNKFREPVCIADSSFPINGDLNLNIFRVFDVESNQQVRYKLPDPIYPVVETKVYTDLVRWMSPKASIKSVIEFDKFYNVEKGRKYRVELVRWAYFCDGYDVENKAIHLNGILDSAVF